MTHKFVTLNMSYQGIRVEIFLLRKIALPYPHKCLFGFVEQKRIDRQEFFKEYSCHKR